VFSQLSTLGLRGVSEKEKRAPADRPTRVPNLQLGLD
jgi:hypothetical protein